MKRTALLTIAAMFTLSVYGQEHTLPLYPAGKVPNWKDAGEKEQAEVNEIVRYSLVQEPNIAVFLPPKRIATGQAVVVCPGGGYGVLAYDWEGTSVAKWLNSKGIAAVVLKYRLPNAKSNITPHLTPLMDAKRAIRMVRANAPQWNVQPGKVGVMGFSAGGHLASTLGTHFDAGNKTATDSVERFSSRPDFMVLIYPVITMDKQYTHSGSRNYLIGANPSADLVQLYSNELQVSKETPSTFIVHSTDDKGVPVENSLLFYQALKAKEVPAEMHIYPYGGHGFGLATGRGYLESWSDRCLDWMRSLK
ncbi:Acetyl esterase/lipase [Cnuella takakiae]|uniref:Acetyl esterase/lipase n=1 Tax=Cnuella takakiae TaxID=1302690 RepID=A0A1M4US59_9BACT|nr:alpha/beta hydrolase [Cnuella takakiae]OLY94840.1 esterase [Cnuella takakiae]SHE59562.1 Acetyl esterase/lipase [Cnuella takakiae]